jgi:hypothetical protein
MLYYARLVENCSWTRWASRAIYGNVNSPLYDGTLWIPPFSPIAYFLIEDISSPNSFYLKVTYLDPV